MVVLCRLLNGLELERFPDKPSLLDFISDGPIKMPYSLLQEAGKEMITSRRSLKVSGHTTIDVFDALYRETLKQRISKSRLIHDILVEGLRRLGHEVHGNE